MREKCSYSEFFWSVFFRIPTEYKEIWIIRIHAECGKLGTRKIPNTNTFQAVLLG